MFDERFPAADGLGLHLDAPASAYWAPVDAPSASPPARGPHHAGMMTAQQQYQQQLMQSQQALALAQANLDSALLQSPVPPPLPVGPGGDIMDDSFVSHSDSGLQMQAPVRQLSSQTANGGVGVGNGSFAPPPAHLFANAFSPFHAATFEVEGDLNGVNPSEQMQQFQAQASTRRPLPPQQPPQQVQQQLYGLQPPSGPQRIQTGDSLLFAPQASSSPIGHLLPDQMAAAAANHNAGGLAFDSLIDRAEQQAQAGRKRARLGAGGVVAPVFDEERDLNASTFGYTADVQSALAAQVAAASANAASVRNPSARLMHQQQQQHFTAPSSRAHHPSMVRIPSNTHISGADSPSPSSHGSQHGGLASVSVSIARGGGKTGGVSAAAHNPGGLTGEKKEKHQLTDRQRRAKIKESMDALKAELPPDVGAKADQATIVASSVAEMKRLKTEVEELREKLQQLEMQQESEDAKAEARRAEMEQMVKQQRMIKSSGSAMDEPLEAPLSTAPFSSMMASLNGAGVAMMRMGLDGRLVEVNLVFELVSGFRAQDVLGHTPCHPPMFGSLSIMPAAFLKAFAMVAPVPAPQPHQYQTHQMLDRANSSGGSSGSVSNASSQASTPNHMPPLSPGRSSSQSADGSPFSPPTSEGADAGGIIGAGGVDVLRNACGPPDIHPGNASVNPASTAAGQSAGNMSQTSVAPLYANASISNFPIVPQQQLQNFFPYKCRSLIDAAVTAGVTQPQPHGNFLVSHLAALPANHVLKLLCRHHTVWGEILESIVTLSLVKDYKGNPDHIIMLSTPDCRRLLTPATHQASEHMAVLTPENVSQADANNY